MTNKLLLSGGCLRPNGFELGEGKYYQSARLVELDTETKLCRIIIQQDEGGSNYPSEHPNLQFTNGCIVDQKLWLPTDTEVHLYQLPDFKLVKTISHPCFHNIHSVTMIKGELVITSTGLDNVVFCDPDSGIITRIVNTEGKAPWHRFDNNIDYRKYHSTRPHDSHPNFVFELDNQVWVTRCTQEDAVNLSQVSDRIDINLGNDKGVHDGLWWKDKLVFTQVDGVLLLCDPIERKMIEIIDPFLNVSNRPLGWCRGLYIEGDMFYVGFSKLRKTGMKSRLKFLSQRNFKYASGNNALVVKVDMRTRKVIDTFETPNGMLDAIYGILPFNGSFDG
ncbi:hypothetical protein AB6T38_06430 [Aliiglaciecola sp. SL4]|uniref:hypothetical protein n=1 Tax=Aliiglaciecola sp. SL4 TaxID=3239806 RepID=UPI00355B7F7A